MDKPAAAPVKKHKRKHKKSAATAPASKEAAAPKAEKKN